MLVKRNATIRMVSPRHEEIKKPLHKEEETHFRYVLFLSIKLSLLELAQSFKIAAEVSLGQSLYLS
jgi:hypothetical protein